MRYDFPSPISAVTGVNGAVGNVIVEKVWTTANITDADSPYAAVDHKSILADATANPVTVTLPVAPTNAIKVRVTRVNSAGSNITIARNGKTINGAAANLTLTTVGTSITLEFNTAANGWWII